ncbi:lytic transglycosylase domain-containing protein [Nitrosophilus alvini]|uniref:lytic transglycosylase domain-containing protein n=1 Tax=Nitrosophilus alvini TaxID=2714855 RepID=UPI00190ADB58|nr:lytic transglycosylase domain-containing protein [Nitrosophilus alvini]
MKTLVLAALLPLFLFSKEITLQFLESKPTSIAKDYYIWRYLSQDITPQEAEKAFYQAKSVNIKIFSRFAKKSGNKEYKYLAHCMKMKPKELIKESAECIATGLTPYKMTKLSLKQRRELLPKIKKFEKTYSSLFVLSSSFPFASLLKSEKEIFLYVFSSVGDSFREKYLNHSIPANYLEGLKKQKGFDTFVNIAVTNPKMKKLHYSLFALSPENLSHSSAFLLAMNAVRYGQKKTALKFLEKAKEKAYYRFDIDKSIFWQYMLTGEKKYLEELCDSFDLNIYTIYAKEKLGRKIDNFVHLRVSNIEKTDIDLKDPFIWLGLLKKINKIPKEKLFEFAKKFNSKQTISAYAFILERAYGYKKHPFITPYEDILKGLTNDEKALVYALARQESRFIPSSISTSYALGAMQIMPFLAKAIAKEMRVENFDLDMMFDPKINVRFALHHLKYLKKYLKHPVLISYAYNGGIGFTKRKVIKNSLFKQKEFEPYLSMELIPYPESRRYAKKVLANYVIYKKIFEKSGKITPLFQKLAEFDHNHRF